MVLERDPALEVIDMPINMGPQHPSTHGVFRMVLVINGEKIVDVKLAGCDHPVPINVSRFVAGILGTPREAHGQGF